jgi:hypothetical protein
MIGRSIPIDSVGGNETLASHSDREMTMKKLLAALAVTLVLGACADMTGPTGDDADARKRYDARKKQTVDARAHR